MKKLSDLQNTILNNIELFILLVCMVLGLFFIWQLDLLFVSKMWGSALDNTNWFIGVWNNGYGSWSNVPQTINYELFPNMVAGTYYDVCMIGIVACWVISLMSIYNLNKKVGILKATIKKYSLLSTS